MEIVKVRLQKKVSFRNRYAVVKMKKDGTLTNFLLTTHQVTVTLAEAQEKKASWERLNPGSSYKIVEIDSASFQN